MQIFEVEISDLDYGNAAMSSVKLYRGIQNQIPEAKGHRSLQYIRTDRRLLDSTPLMGETFDYFIECLGLPMRKANTASVTTKPNESVAYGAPCRVFPINGTTYLYSLTVSDFIRISHEVRLKAYNSMRQQYNAPEIPSMNWQEPLDTFLSNHRDELFGFIQANAAELQEHYKMRTTKNINVLKAAKGEILLYGTPHFLAIKL